jgi:hypothetical protein
MNRVIEYIKYLTIGCGLGSASNLPILSAKPSKDPQRAETLPEPLSKTNEIERPKEVHFVGEKEGRQSISPVYRQPTVRLLLFPVEQYRYDDQKEAIMNPSEENLKNVLGKSVLMDSDIKKTVCRRRTPRSKLRRLNAL